MSDHSIRASQFNGHSDLKPCPFCGAKWDGAISGDSSIRTGLLVYDNAPNSDTTPWAHVACLECGAGQTSITNWNTRFS